MAEEKVFFDAGDVKVTSSRFMTFGKTQALAGITAVSTHYVSPSRLGPIILGVVGLLCFAFSWVVGLILVVGAVLWWISQKTVYIVRLESASGVTDALSSKDKDFVFQVSDALNEAIVHRG
ncbi:MAG: DUF6232 family protein [Dysgonomonas sp.]|nr:DUF6232 family protein [Dysgonomonas sp.]